MTPNPFIGVIYHWIGGFAAGSFYIPYKGVKKWSWETYWLVGGVFSWIIAPWFFATLLVPEVVTNLRAAGGHTLWPVYVFGALWGLGGLTFGLTMRYLGIALGMAVALGYCAAFGTLVPPIYHHNFHELLDNKPGLVILAGVITCLVGIATSGAAGMSKERELSPEEKVATVKEFDFKKGMIVATFSGIMSSCFAFGLDAGKPLADITKGSLLAHGGSELWRNLPVLIVVMLGGFTTNFIWCLYLNLKNRSSHEYLNLRNSATEEISALQAVSPFNAHDLEMVPGTGTAAAPLTPSAAEEAAASAAASHGGPMGPATHTGPAPLLNNYFFAGLAGVTWYLQFFFYSMGETQMGQYGFSSWTLHMASIIIFSTLWGISLREWKGSSPRTYRLLSLGLAILIGSTVVVGVGNYLKANADAAKPDKVAAVAR